MRTAPEREVVGLPVPEVERYLNQREMAALMGISVRQVKRLTADGMPSCIFGKRSRRYKASVALAWARERGGR